MEKNVYAQMYMDQYKTKLKNLYDQCVFYSDGVWVECHIDENILLKGMYESRLKGYQLREYILEIKENSYSKKDLKKVEKEVLGYYYSHEKKLRKEFKKELSLNKEFILNRKESLRDLDEVNGMILYNMILTY